MQQQLLDQQLVCAASKCGLLAWGRRLQANTNHQLLVAAQLRPLAVAARCYYATVAQQACCRRVLLPENTFSGGTEPLVYSSCHWALPLTLALGATARRNRWKEALLAESAPTCPLLVHEQ